MNQDTSRFPSHDAEELRAFVLSSGRLLAEALDRLEARARWEVDLRRRLAAHATELVAAGFLAGVLIGLLTARRR